MKLAIFGGSFNPIHYGHLLSATWVLEEYNYDKVLFIPANTPVHKDASSFPAAIHRYNMVKLAIDGYKYFDISNIEISRGGNSYTIDTVLELKERLSLTQKPGLIIGDDLITGLHKWKNIDVLQEEVDIVCLRRENNLIQTDYKVRQLQNRTIEISSTEIRDRIKNNRLVDFLLPESVKQYILRNNLYKN